MPVPRKQDATRALFDRWAETYDADTADPSGPLIGYGESLLMVKEMVSTSVGATLLDIGIGTGSLAALFEKRVAEITGIDVSKQMLVRCRAAHPDFRLEEGSFTEIPFPDARFDIIVSSFTFHEINPEERSAACLEVARVLRPGGQVVILDIMFPSGVAVNEARQAIGSSWDPDEEYPLVGELDTHLRGAGVRNLRWRQSAAYHWVVVGRQQPRQADEPTD